VVAQTFPAAEGDQPALAGAVQYRRGAGGHRGETAIDVFYITRDGAKLWTRRKQKELKHALLAAMKTNAG